MQNLELILLIASFVYICFSQSINKKLKRPYVLGLLAFVLIIHLLFEGQRWQMIPAYLLWFLAIIAAFVRSEQKRSAVARGLSGFGILVLLVLSVALPSALPVF